MIAVVVAVVLGGAIYALVFGSPNSENRYRDSPDAPIGHEGRPVP